MSYITGWFGHPGSATDPDINSSFFNNVSSSPYQKISHPSFTLAGTTQCDTATVDSISVCIHGLPRWSDPSLQSTSDQLGLANTVAQFYTQYGIRLLSELQGGFSLVVYDQTRQSGLLAIDKMGIKSLCYSINDYGLIFGPPTVISRHPNFNPVLDPQALFAYLYFHMIPSPLSIYKGISKLLPGQFLLWDHGRAELGFFWQPSFADSPASECHLAKQLHNRLMNSVGANVVSPETTGSFLSGGLDSSTITGLLKQHIPAQATAFSIGFSAEGYDEMEYARASATHFDVPLVEYYVTPEDVVEAIPQIAACYDEPFGNASAVPTYYCARLAQQHGMSRLLAGDGGDELFAGNARYAKQQIFALYEHVPLWLQQKLVEPLVNSNIPGMGKLRSYVSQARVPMPERMETYNFLHRSPLSEIFVPEFLASINADWPIEHLQEIYRRPDDASLLKRMLWLDWKITLADNDLRKVNRMCDLAGIEVAYPMLDDSVVQLAASIPDLYLMRRFELRSFYRRAMKDFLPPSTLRKSKHGFGLPFGLWLQTHRQLQEMAYSSLEHPSLNGIIQKSYINNLKKSHQSQHASYYGVMIWILMMLAQWMEAHR